MEADNALGVKLAKVPHVGRLSTAPHPFRTESLPSWVRKVQSGLRVGSRPYASRTYNEYEHTQS